jgi:signal transduction histidine kinase
VIVILDEANSLVPLEINDAGVGFSRRTFRGRGDRSGSELCSVKETVTAVGGYVNTESELAKKEGWRLK